MKTRTTKKTVTAKKKTARTKATKAKKSTKLEVFVKKNKSDYPSNTWVVFTTDGEKRKQPRVFEGNLSRDNVRCAYAQSIGCTIQETRSRRVENY